MANLSLRDALILFSDGLQSLGKARTIDKANEAAEKIRRNEELNQEQRSQELQQLSNRFRLDLIKGGSSANEAGLASEALTPSIPTSINNALFTGLLTGDKNLVEVAEKVQDIISRPSMEAMGIREKIQKSEKKEKMDVEKLNRINTTLNRFTDKESKKELESLSAVEGIRSNLKTRTQPGFGLAQRGLARLAQGTGVISDKDAAAINPDPDFVTAARNFFSTGFSGLPAEKRFLTLEKLTDGLEKVQLQRLKANAVRFSKSREGLIPGLTAQELESRLLQSTIGNRMDKIAGEEPKPSKKSTSYIDPSTGKVLQGTIDHNGIIFNIEGKPVARIRRE